MRNKSIFLNRMIALLLSVSLIFTSIQMPVKAEKTESDSIFETQTKHNIEEDNRNESYTILSEVKEEREENSKTFLLNSGSFLVAQYGEPVHYKDGDGNWQEIDNSIEEVDAGTEDEGYETTEKSGKNARIKFSKHLKEEHTVSIKHVEFPISWGFAGAEKQTVEIQETREENEEKKNNNQFLKVNNTSEILCYPEIYEGVDATYEVRTSGLKENLILKQPGTQNEFYISYNKGKLLAVQTDSRTISLMDGDRIIYQIQAPYMKDASGSYSDKVVLEITEQKNSKMVVMLKADNEWLSEEERSYPVILDPVIYTATTKSAIDTTFVASGQATNNFSNKLELLVGKESSEYENCRTLVKFSFQNCLQEIW